MNEIPNKTFLDGMHPAQRGFLDVFDSLTKRFFWLNWHRRARKTTALLNLLIRECCLNPKCVYDYVGPTYKQAKSIIWRDPHMLNAYLPDKRVMNWQKNESELYVRFANRSMLNIRGADNPDSLRGTNAIGVGFDEWAMINPMVWQEVYRPIIAQESRRWAAFLFTPKGQNHAYTGINRAMNEPDSYVSTLTADTSGLIPADELEKAKRDMPLAMFMQEFMCSFVAEEEMTLITSAMLENLRHNIIAEHRIKTLVACDPATGGDECCVKVFKNTREIDQEIYRDRDEMKIVARLQLLMHKHETRNIVIDTIGLGGGIASRLRQLEYNVLCQKSSESPSDSDRFANQKAEMWWSVSRKVQDMMCEYPDDIETRRQLSAVRYRIQPGSGKLIVEPKEITKKTLGCSPDRADTWVMGQYYLDFIDADGEGEVVSHASSPSYVSLGVG